MSSNTLYTYDSFDRIQTINEFNFIGIDLSAIAIVVIFSY